MSYHECRMTDALFSLWSFFFQGNGMDCLVLKYEWIFDFVSITGLIPFVFIKTGIVVEVLCNIKLSLATLLK